VNLTGSAQPSVFSYKHVRDYLRLRCRRELGRTFDPHDATPFNLEA